MCRQDLAPQQLALGCGAHLVCVCVRVCVRARACVRAHGTWYWQGGNVYSRQQTLSGRGSGHDDGDGSLWGAAHLTGT